MADRDHPMWESMRSSGPEAEGPDRFGTSIKTVCRQHTNVFRMILLHISGTNLAVSGSVVVERPNSAPWLGRALSALASLIEVITEVDHVVVLILAGSIAISIEIAVG